MIEKGDLIGVLDTFPGVPSRSSECCHVPAVSGGA